MNLQPNITDVFFISPESMNPMVITLAMMEEKIQIYQNLHKIKDLVNDDEQPFYFNDYLPPELNEMKRHEREIFRKNKRLDEDDRIQMKMKGSRLKIEGAPYQAKVNVPVEEDILKLQVQQIDQIFELETCKGEKLVKKNSVFIGYSIRTHNIKTTQQAYMKLKLLHGDARHIVCACRIPGSQPHLDESHCDDGEFAAGRALVRWMEQNYINSVAIFVVRYFGGQKMGPEGFDCYIEAAKTAVVANYQISINTPVPTSTTMSQHQQSEE